MEIKNYEPTESNIERLFLINWCQILNLRACDQLNTSYLILSFSPSNTPRLHPTL